MTETRIHPTTGQTLRRGVRTETVRHGNRSAEVEVPGWYPDGDGDSIHKGADLEAVEAVRKRLKESDRRYLSG